MMRRRRKLDTMVSKSGMKQTPIKQGQKWVFVESDLSGALVHLVVWVDPAIDEVITWSAPFPGTDSAFAGASFRGSESLFRKCFRKCD